MNNYSQYFGPYFYMKYLGAWGGDFAWLLTNQKESVVREKLNDNGHDIVFSFAQMAAKFRPLI